jgi:hypothetical protein
MHPSVTQLFSGRKTATRKLFGRAIKPEEYAHITR